MKRLCPFFFAALWIIGCAVGPDYKRPAVTPPPAFREAENAATNSMGDLPWWRLFEDPALQGLIQTALTNNYDLRTAVARVEEARAVLAQNRSVFFPQVTYQAGVGAGRNVLGNSPYRSGGPAGDSFEFAGNVSWEIDLWGRIRRLNESARSQLLATQEARRDVTVSLIASVAEAYFQLLALDEELAIAEETTNSFRESWRIFNQRLQGGVSSKLETASAEALFDSAAATIPELRRQRIAQEDQISILLGFNPGPVARPRAGLRETALPDIPPGLPSALLERRPDIRQAEQLMRAANAQIGVAKADLYPTLSLTGLFGQVSPELSTLTSGGANAWEAAAGLTGPIIEGGLLRARLRQARAAWDETRWQYLSTLLRAFGEVSDALVARQQLELERVEQARAVAAYQEAVQVAGQRYRGGQAGYYELLQEQQLLFPAQNVLVQAHLNQLLATVQLYKALGGGWEAGEPAPSSRTTR
ncbi:MAG: efflux transporter outer membrane subunit [Verrucomicrobiota bacterium]|jgi:multidrug efflux system outer membrane protein